jgi:excisionase family DNA binding protein
MVVSFDELPRLVSLKQAAEYLGLSKSQVRNLAANKKIASTRIGTRTMIPRDGLEQFIAEITVQPCRDETLGHASASSKNAEPTTSFGAKADEAASAQRALRTANLLKQHSGTSSISGRAKPDPVIQQKSS